MSENGAASKQWLTHVATTVGMGIAAWGLLLAISNARELDRRAFIRERAAANSAFVEKHAEIILNLKYRQDAIEGRLTSLESKFESVGQADVGQIFREVELLRKDLREMRAELNQVYPKFGSPQDLRRRNE